MLKSKCVVRVSILTVVYAVGAAIQSSAHACDMSFEGSEFLKAARDKGVAPLSTSQCVTVQLAANAFHASPAEPCLVHFLNATWLVDGFSFKGLQGGGVFTATTDSRGIAVTIAASMGFRLSFITVSANRANCDNLAISAVLK